MDHRVHTDANQHNTLVNQDLRERPARRIARMLVTPELGLTPAADEVYANSHRHRYHHDDRQQVHQPHPFKYQLFHTSINVTLSSTPRCRMPILTVHISKPYPFADSFKPQYSFLQHQPQCPP